MDGYNKHNNNKIITQTFEIYPENLKKILNDLRSLDYLNISGY